MSKKHMKTFQQFILESKINMTPKLSALLNEFGKDLKSKIHSTSRTSCDMWKEILEELKLQNIRIPKDWNKIYTLIQPYIHMSKSYFETYLLNVICPQTEDE